MKIYKRNHEYSGMFWYFLLWQSEAVYGGENLFFSTLKYLLPYTKQLEIVIKHKPEDWIFFYRSCS